MRILILSVLLALFSVPAIVVSEPFELIGSIESSLHSWQRAVSTQYVANRVLVSSKFTLKSANNTGIRHALANGSVDFGLSTIDPAYQSFTPPVNLPDLSVYPIAGYPVVISFNCGPSAICRNDFPLSLTRSQLCSIFNGQIRTWKEIDARLSVDPIVVVVSQDPSNAHTDVITRICSFVDANWTSTIGDSLSPRWMNANRTGPIAIFGPNGIANGTWSAALGSSCCSSMAQFVSVVPYSITYLSLRDSVAYGLPYASIVNQAGILVKPNISSTEFAVAERSVTYVVRASGTQPSLLDATNSHAYPLVGTVYLQLFCTRFRISCTARREMLMYVHWMISDETVKRIARLYDVAIFDDAVSLKILEYFMTQVRCDGVSIVPLITPHVPRLTTPPLAGPLAQQTAPFSSMRFTPQPVSSSNAGAEMQQNKQTELALVTPLDWSFNQNMSIGDVMRTAELELLPMAYAAIQPLVKLPAAVHATTVNDSMYGGALYPFVISVETLAQIYLGEIRSFLHPAITRVNPTLKARFDVTSADPNITVMVCCSSASSSTVATTALVAMLHQRSPEFAADPDVPALPISSTSWQRLMNRASAARYVQVNSEGNIVPQVSSTDGAIGFTISFAANSFGSASSVHMLLTDDVPRQEAVSLSTVSMQSCSAGLNVHECDIDFVKAGSTCWPLTYPICLISNSMYSDVEYGYDWSNQIDLSCMAGKQLAYLTEALTGLTSDYGPGHVIQQLLPTFGYAPAVSHFLGEGIQNLLSSIVSSTSCTSSGSQLRSSLMVPTTTQWEVSPPIVKACVGLLVVGLFVVALTGLTLFRHRSHATVRAASFSMLCTVLVGLAFLLIGACLWVIADTDSQCNSVLWLVTIALTLIVCPTLLRIWRIWKIFGTGNKLKVVKISNMRLNAFIATAILVDIVLLSIVQSSSPLSLLSRTVAESDMALTEYGQCGFESQSDSTYVFFVLQLVMKGGLILFATMAAYFSKHVVDRFNESSNVMFTLGNITLAVGTVIPFLLVLDPVGDQLVLLLFVPIVEIAVVTWVFIFLPKITTVWNYSRNESSPLAPIMQSLASTAMAGPNSTTKRIAPSEGAADITKALDMIQTMPINNLKQFSDNLSLQMAAARARLHQEKPPAMNAWTDTTSPSGRTS